MIFLSDDGDENTLMYTWWHSKWTVRMVFGRVSNIIVDGSTEKKDERWFLMHELMASLCCWEGATADIDSAERLHENITPIITGTSKRHF